MRVENAVKVMIDNEFAVYTTPEKVEELEREGSVFFEDGCYDVMLDKETDGWYRRYGTLYLKDGIPVLFQDGDGWKIYDFEGVADIPVWEGQGMEKGFHLLEREPELDEEELGWKAYGCYLMQYIEHFKIEKDT